MLFTNALNKDASTWDWNCAASVAIGMGDLKTYHALCGVALSRRVSGLEGEYMGQVAVPMLLHPQDGIMTRILVDLVDRGDLPGSSAGYYMPHLRAWLAYRLGHHQEAHAMLDKVTEVRGDDSYYGRQFKHFVRPYIDAHHFLRAMLFAQEGKRQEAVAEFGQADRLIGPPPSVAHPRDLGDGFHAWYEAAAARREAEQVFRDKAIPIPPSP
jgi:hypothetical protein